MRDPDAVAWAVGALAAGSTPTEVAGRLQADLGIGGRLIDVLRAAGVPPLVAVRAAVHLDDARGAAPVRRAADGVLEACVAVSMVVGASIRVWLDDDAASWTSRIEGLDGSVTMSLPAAVDLAAAVAIVEADVVRLSPLGLEGDLRVSWEDVGSEAVGRLVSP